MIFVVISMVLMVTMTYAEEPVSNFFEKPVPTFPETATPTVFCMSLNGLATTDHRLSFSWIFNGWKFNKRAIAYQLQVCDNPGFGSPIIDVITAESVYSPDVLFKDGTYYWRVRALYEKGRYSDWSELAQTIIYTDYGLKVSNENDLGIGHQMQHKDTGMLCLESPNLTGDHAWDNEHPGYTSSCRLCAVYCVRASISMVNSYYQSNGEKKLSQDRISYHIFGDGAPEEDLGYDEGVYSWDTKESFAWALSVGESQIEVVSKADLTFDQVKVWIDAGRPIIAIIEVGVNHAVVWDGYTEGDTNKVHEHDPMVGGQYKWNYDTYFDGQGRELIESMLRQQW